MLVGIFFRVEGCLSVLKLFSFPIITRSHLLHITFNVPKKIERINMASPVPLKIWVPTSGGSAARTNMTTNSQTPLPPQRRCGNLSNFLDFGMPSDGRPNLPVVLRLLVVFIGFAVFLSIAGRLPAKAMWIAVIIVGSLCTIGNTIIYAFNARSHRELSYRLVYRYYFINRANVRSGTDAYRPNLGNTAAVVLLTIPLFTILYVYLWYPQLKADYSVSSTDYVV